MVASITGSGGDWSGSPTVNRITSRPSARWAMAVICTPQAAAPRPVMRSTSGEKFMVASLLLGRRGWHVRVPGSLGDGIEQLNKGKPLAALRRRRVGRRTLLAGLGALAACGPDAPPVAAATNPARAKLFTRSGEIQAAKAATADDPLGREWQAALLRDCGRILAQ